MVKESRKDVHSSKRKSPKYRSKLFSSQPKDELVEKKMGLAEERAFTGTQGTKEIL